MNNPTSQQPTKLNPRKVIIDEKMCHKSTKKPKEIVTAQDVNGNRKLVVPDRDPIDIPGIFPKSEFHRLKKQAHIVTLKDRMQMLEEAEQKKNALQQESEQRKEFLRRAQAKQNSKIGSKLSDVERQAKAKNLYLLERSFNLIQEQDNRVKLANGIILATKCRAIRNAQIAEKELINKQLQEENYRLDLMMEQQRQKQLELEGKRQEDEEKKKQKYIAQLSDQMRTNEIERLIEAERIEEESKMMNKAFLAIQKEEEAKMREKKEMQEKMREDLKRANDELEHYKLIQKEEQRIADLRIQKFMKEKLEREEARDQELAIARAAKQQEIARMQSQQQKALDVRSAIDEMNALKAQEEVERKWREKEMMAAKMRKDQLEALRLERQKQIDDLRRAAAITLAREEEDFHRVAQIQKVQFDKEMAERNRRKEEAERHRKFLLKQIDEKERERISIQKEKFEEGKMLKLEEQRKEQHIREHLKKKVDGLRNKQIPEQYIEEIKHNIDGILQTK